MIGRTLRGIVSGAWGVLAMAGVSITTRRFVEPTAPLPRMHYEAVVDKIQAAVKPGEQLDVEQRIRLGEIAHLAAGAFWGAVFALFTRDRVISRPVVQGATWGTAVWAIAFAGYMPGLKISKALWQMSPYELFRIWISHAVFATATLLALKAAED